MCSEVTVMENVKTYLCNLTIIEAVRQTGGQVEVF